MRDASSEARIEVDIHRVGMHQQHRAEFLEPPGRISSGGKSAAPGGGRNRSNRRERGRPAPRRGAGGQAGSATMGQGTRTPGNSYREKSQASGRPEQSSEPHEWARRSRGYPRARATRWPLHEDPHEIGESTHRVPTIPRAAPGRSDTPPARPARQEKARPAAAARQGAGHRRSPWKRCMPPPPGKLGRRARPLPDVDGSAGGATTSNDIPWLCET